MRQGGDVFGVLGWGLRRYGWVVALFVIGFGLLVPTALERVPAQYEAQAQVGPAQALTLQKLDALPRVGDTVFNNGTVAAAVRTSFVPPLPPSTDVIPGRVELIAAQDNIVFTVVGRGPTPESAQRIANIAAASFANEINKYSRTIGSFAVQQLARRPGQPVDRPSGVLTLALGVLAGLTAGVGAVAFLLVWRRPVIDVATAEDASDAAVFGRVLLGTSRDFTRGLPHLCRRVLSGSADTLLLAGPRSTRRERRLLAEILTDTLAPTRDVERWHGEADLSGNGEVPTAGRPHRDRLVIVDDPTQDQLVNRPESSLTLLIVREGISQSALRRQVERYLDGGAEGVVLVRRTRRGRPRRGRSATRARRQAVPDVGPEPARAAEPARGKVRRDPAAVPGPSEVEEVDEARRPQDARVAAK
jgi:hypothetical protein